MERIFKLAFIPGWRFWWKISGVEAKRKGQL